MSFDDPEAGTAPKLQTLGVVLADLKDALPAEGGAKTVAVRDLVEVMEENSFAMLLTLFSLLLVSPLSAIPGATTVVGLTVAGVLAQWLLGKKQVWLPGFLLNRSMPVHKLRQALVWMERPVAWLERHLKPRLHWVVRKPLSVFPMLLVFCAALCAPLMEVIPASGSTVGAAISLFGAGQLARDGLFVLVGSCLAAIAPILLWLLLT